MRVGIDPSKDAPETAQLDSSRQEMTGESVSLIDTDVHNYTRSIDDLIPHLSRRWKTYIIQGGIKLPGVSLYPKMYAQAARRDAIPYEGGVAGSEPAFRENNDSILGVSAVLS